MAKRRKFESDLVELATGLTKKSGPVDTSRKRIVVAHVHYPEVWEELRDSINNIAPNEIVITTTQGHDFIRSIREDFPNADVFQVENRGRDIWPLVQVAQRGIFKEPSVVFKIHSKMSRHLLNGNRWRKDLLFSISGTPAIASHIYLELQHSKYSLLGDDRYLRSMQESRVVDNPEYAGWAAANQLSLNLDEVQYIDGTIFACKSEVLDQLAQLSLDESDFVLEETNIEPFDFGFALKLYLLGKMRRIGKLKKIHEVTDLRTRPASEATYALEGYIGFLARKFGNSGGVLESFGQ